MTGTEKASAHIQYHLSFPAGGMRLLTILHGLEWEMKTGGRLTGKAPKCTTILRKEFGLSGSRANLYARYRQLLVAHGVVRDC